MYLRVDKQLIVVYSPRDFQYGRSVLEKEALAFIIIAEKCAHLEYRVEAVVKQLVFVEHDDQPVKGLSFLLGSLRGVCFSWLISIFKVVIDVRDALIFR